MIKNDGEEIIMHDSKDKNNAHTVIVRHRASREDQKENSPRRSRMSPANVSYIYRPLDMANWFHLMYSAILKYGGLWQKLNG